MNNLNDEIIKEKNHKNNDENHLSKKDHDHSHNHDLNLSGKIELNRKKIFFVVLLNFLITFSEIVGGIFSKSLSLLSDAFHNFGDTMAIVLSWFALIISKKEKDKNKTYGYKRAQIIVAFLNSQFLIVLCILLIIEAIKKFINPVVIKSSVMLVVAIIGFIANLVSTLLLHRDSNHSLNIRSSYLHLLGDTVSSVGVILGAILINIFKIYFIDSIITIIIAIYLGYESIKIIIKTINILMQSSADLDYQQIKKDIESLPSVNSLHHVHTWLSDEKTIYFEGHVELCDIPLSESTKILDDINKILSERYNISHTTIQFEVDRGCNKGIFNIKTDK
ncbi:MAG: cation diffusion facilitator family transporter [Exilispira sp.]|jgi:cobalt-zinc-cadmium efflux system protein|nr:cation diffusion facilitator family transporter [Exilispira sp.]